MVPGAPFLEEYDVIGVDPGKTTGICVIRVNTKKQTWQLLSREEIGGMEDADRLHTLSCRLHMLCYRTPNEVTLGAVAMEYLQAHKQYSHQEKAEAQGVIRLTAYETGAFMSLYAPTTIRKVVTGRGDAKAGDISRVLRDLTGLQNPRPGFTAHQQDALAVALCYAMLDGRLNKLKPAQRGEEDTDDQSR